MDRMTETEGYSPKFGRSVSFSDDHYKTIFKSDSLKLVRCGSSPATQATTSRPENHLNVPLDMETIYVRSASEDIFSRTDSTLTSTSPEASLEYSSSAYSSEIHSFTSEEDSPQSKKILLVPPNSPTSSSTASTSASTENSGFTWAFFNCPATIKLAGLLLLAGGLFALTVGVIAASTAIAATGAVITGIGAILSIYGHFNKPELMKRSMQSSEESLDSNGSSMMSS